MRSNSSRFCIFVAILHLLGLTDILQSFSQSSMIFRSFFSFVVACFTLFLPLPNDFVIVTMSSANCDLMVSMYLGGGMSFTNMLNKVGPMTDP